MLADRRPQRKGGETCPASPLSLETSIDRAKITPTPDGGYRMQWSMRLLNGRLIKGRRPRGSAPKASCAAALMPKLRGNSRNRRGQHSLEGLVEACATISAKR